MSHLTAIENVALPLDLLGIEDSEARAKAALEQVGLGARTRHFPHQLSGGEKQRVAIARAFVSSPGLLLADEPSGNLDSNTGRSVMNLLFEQVRTSGRAMILVTHDEDLARECSRRLVLENGVLRAE